MNDRRYQCGPLSVSLAAPTAALHDKVVETLNLYTAPWPKGGKSIAIRVRTCGAPTAMRQGSFLTCGRMRVDAAGLRMTATCASGSFVVCSKSRDRWSIGVPRQARNGEAVPEDIEDLVGLVLTTGWRDLGKVPIHAGSVLRDGCCAILCATSGGGKTTLTAAMIRRGWKTLGDDKLLLSIDGDGRPRLAALIHTFNLHPDCRSWFPEVGDLTRLPRYSAWTDKRKVRIQDVWPSATLDRGEPTHLIELDRSAEFEGIRIEPLPRAEILPRLMRQTVIPRDRGLARRLMATIATAAPRLRGLRVVVGNGAHADPAGLDALDEALQ